MKKYIKSSSTGISKSEFAEFMSEVEQAISGYGSLVDKLYSLFDGFDIPEEPDTIEDAIAGLSDADVNELYTSIVAFLQDAFDGGKDEETPSELYSLGVFNNSELVKSDILQYLNDNYRMIDVDEAELDRIVSELADILKAAL